MASCSAYWEASTKWKESVSEHSKEKLCESILGIFQAQVPHICRNPEPNMRFLNSIRSWVEKSLIEATEQKEFIQKVSRQICHMIAKVQSSLIPAYLVNNAAKAKEKAEMLRWGQNTNPTSSLVQKMIQLDLGNTPEISGQNLGTLDYKQPQILPESKFRAPRTGLALSNLPSQFTPNLQQGKCSSSEDQLPPHEYAHQKLEDDARLNPDNQMSKREFAKHEAELIKWQLPELMTVFVDTTLRSLQLQEMQQKIQHFQTEEEAKEFEFQMYYTKRVQECVKQAVQPKEFLTDDFDERPKINYALGRLTAPVCLQVLHMPRYQDIHCHLQQQLIGRIRQKTLRGVPPG